MNTTVSLSIVACGPADEYATGPGFGVDNWQTEDVGVWLTESGGAWLLDE